MAYDSGRRTIVMFGGTQSVAPTDATVWQWNGAWSAFPASETSSAPAPRLTFGMAFDPDVGETVVFGGQDGNGATLTDAWSWNGARWQSLKIAGLPSSWAQYEIGMVYDPALAGLVVYGEAGDAGVLRWTSATGVDEVCALGVDIDADGDGLTGSHDPDCQR
jgi:hypothetical protein